MSLLGATAVLATAGATLIAGLRARDRRRFERLRQERAGESYATFRAAFAGEGVGEGVMATVYDFFARGTAAGPEIAPRRTDRLWLDQGVDFPEELAEVLTQLLANLGVPRSVSPAEIVDLRTVDDVVRWQEAQVRGPARPA